MSATQQKLLRVYKPFDVNTVKEHVLVYGDLSGQCGNCQNMDVKIETVSCPNCRTNFRYIAFRNVAHHMPKIVNIAANRQDLTIIDYDDYNRTLAAKKAEDLFK